MQESIIKKFFKSSSATFALVASTTTLILSFPLSASAASLLFDFEEFPTTSPITSLLMTRGSLNINLSRTSGSAFNITNIAAFAPVDWGSRSLVLSDNFFINDGFLYSLSEAVTSFAIEAADFAPSDEDTVTLTAYDGVNGTGNIVDTDSVFYGLQGLPSVATVSTSSASILSVVARGGSADFPNSMLWDNLRVNSVPSVPGTSVPGPLPLLGVGAAFGCSRKLRKRIKRSTTPEIMSAIG